MHNKAKIYQGKGAAVTVLRPVLKGKKIVYILVVDRRIKYPYGRSKIVYIGTTKKGVRRIAASAAGKAEKVLRMYGVRKIDAYIIGCTPRTGVKMWTKF